MIWRCLLVLFFLLSNLASAQTPEPPYRREQTAIVGQDGYSDTFTVEADCAYVSSAQKLFAIKLPTFQRQWEVPVAEKQRITVLKVHQGVVYAMSDTDGQPACLEALEQATGKRLWRVETGRIGVAMALHEGQLFYLCRDGRVTCLELSTRRPLWESEKLSDDTWSETGKLAVADDALAVNVGSATSCLDFATGRTLWKETKSYLFSAPLVTTSDVVWVPVEGGSVGRNAKSGRILWRSRHSPSHFARNYEGKLLGLNDSLVLLEPKTGKSIWEVSLPSRYVSFSEKATLVRGQIFVRDDSGVVSQFDPTGRRVWSSETAEAAIPLPVWSDGKSLVSFDGRRLFRYVKGEESPLPSETSARRALAEDLVERFEELDGPGRKRLAELGDEAFEPVLAAYVSVATKARVGSFEGAFDGLFAVLEKISTKEHWDVLAQTVREARSDSEVRKLTKIVMEVGPSEEVAPYLVSEYRRLAREGQSMAYEGFVTEYLAKSSEPEAVAFMLEQLRDPKSSLRELAYYHLAGTGGEEGLQAVLAERHGRRLLAPLSERVLSEENRRWVTGEQPVREHTDSSGRTWGLITSGALGNGGDLWLVEKSAGEWSRPVFTGLTLGYPGSSVSDLTPEEKRVQELLDGPWSSALVGDREILQDSDGDGLTDLVERRLTTNPKLADTDGDGAGDATDPWPNAPWRDDLSDSEQVLAAAWEARFHFSPPGVGAFVFLAEPGMRPFEIAGGFAPVVWQEERGRKVRTPLEASFSRGVGLLSFSLEAGKPTGEGADRVLDWNENRSEARVTVNAVFGPLNGTGYEAVVRKFGSNWVVVRLKLSWVS